MINIIDLMRNGQDPLKAIHKGVVVDNNDPAQKCRVKVRVPGVLDGDGIPWAIPIASAFLGDGESDRVEIPEVGTEVSVSFPTGDQHFPFYTGRWHSKEVPEEFKENYPNRYGFKDSTGTVFYIDKVSKEVHFKHCSGFQFDIDQEANFTLTTPGGGKVDIAKALEIIAKEHIKLDTPLVDGTGEIKDKVRKMSEDRAIYNGHDHVGDSGGSTSPPNSKQ
ncbi:putative tail protein [Escherichia phage vB_EcoM_IME392]|nr:putative tail protein [Escherichia phage vB_EcoM_IME392]